MNKAGSTPGPWDHRNGVVYFNPGGIDLHNVDDDGGKAKAQLIAAAPDLLSILKTIDEYIDHADIPPRMSQNIKKAIAKAEGNV